MRSTQVSGMGSPSGGEFLRVVFVCRHQKYAFEVGAGRWAPKQAMAMDGAALALRTGGQDIDQRAMSTTSE